MGTIVDFSKAEPSRNFRNTYLAKYDRLTECIKKQREEFVSYHDQLEVVRKERAAIIENVVKMLKDMDIKADKPLGKYDNEELISELNKLIKENPDKNTEDIEIAIIKIKNRYRDIENLSKKLITYSKRIDNYPDEQYEAKMEADYNDEIVISKDSFKTQNVVEEVKEIEQIEEKEEVIDHHEASNQILESLAKIIDFHKPSKEETEDIEEIEETDEDKIDSILKDITPLETEPLYKEAEEDELKDTLFTLNKNMSLQNIVKHVYEETDDLDYESELWVSVYNYDDNSEKIDEIADELGVSIEIVACTPGLLNGVTLKFPTELRTYDQVVNDKSNSSKDEEEHSRKIA